MLWDPKDHLVAFFIDRFRDVADTEGVPEILKALLLYLKGDTLEWHTTSLTTNTKIAINRSLDK